MESFATIMGPIALGQPPPPPPPIEDLPTHNNQALVTGCVKQAEQLEHSKKRPLDSPSNGRGNQSQSTYFKNPSLPQELKEKFLPLECQLCNVKVGSTITAKIHYAGKPHEKKMKTFLIAHCEQTGEPMPKMIKNVITTRLNESEQSFCRTCSIGLSSVAQAQEHYAGKSHAKMLRSRVQAQPSLPNAPYDEKGRFGIGSGFQAEEDPVSLHKPSSKSKWTCEMCDITVTDGSQFEMHMKGARHRKTVKKNSASIVPVAVNPSESILASVTRPSSWSKADYSMHRTPTGQYYCQSCNVTMNSEDQFVQHIESKKHKSKESKNV